MILYQPGTGQLSYIAIKAHLTPPEVVVCTANGNAPNPVLFECRSTNNTSHKARLSLKNPYPVSQIDLSIGDEIGMAIPG